MSGDVTVGVLALQGAFREHVALFRKVGVKSIEVRTEEDLQRCDGLVFPGGESTSMGIISQTGGGKMLEALRAWVRARPSWGVCAGLILLADNVEGQKQGGQTLIGGLHVAVTRNMFGSQIASFEADVTFSPPASAIVEDTRPFHALFIRAPGINAVSEDVSVICELSDPSGPKIVGVRQVHSEGALSCGVRLVCGEGLYQPLLCRGTSWARRSIRS
jgi:5'-phosphate synthase pdxT subunit